MKYHVDILEVHKGTIEIDLSEGATREEVIALAEETLDEHDCSFKFDYMMDTDEWCAFTEQGVVVT